MAQITHAALCIKWAALAGGLYVGARENKSGKHSFSFLLLRGGGALPERGLTKSITMTTKPTIDSIIRTIKTLPVAEYKLGGQTTKYVQLDSVLGWVEELERLLQTSARADETGVSAHTPEAHIRGFRDMPLETQEALATMAQCAIKHMSAPGPLDALKNLDSRPARGGWAPGRYYVKCRKCQCRFTGDKRAYACADCAYAETAHPSNPE